MTVLGHSPLSRPVARQRSSSPQAWIPTLHFHPPSYTLQMAAPRAAIEIHLVTGRWCLCGRRACAPLLKFSIKAVRTAAQGSLLVSRWSSHTLNLRPPHWSWALPSTSYKFIKNITSLLFLVRRTRSPPTWLAPNPRTPKLIRLGRVTVLPAQLFSYTRTSALAALKCRSTVEQGPPPVGAAERSPPQ